MINLIIVLIVVIVVYIGVKRYTNNLKGGGCGCGCGGSSVKPQKVEVEDKEASHYPYTKKLKIDGMTCEHCKLRIENLLNGQKEGVWAEVDLANGTALVRMKKELTEERLREIITYGGYTLVSVETI